MDPILVTNIVLSILTGIYVTLTFWILRESRRSNETVVYPQFFCEMAHARDYATLSLVNPGDIPALDVNVLLLAQYHEDDQDVVSFLSQHVSEGWPQRSRILETHEGFYCVYDNLSFSVLPAGKRVSVRPGFPRVADQYLGLLQFRNVFGQNFCKIYWYNTDLRNSDRRLVLGSVTPPGMGQAPRITFDGSELSPDRGRRLPSFVANEFLPFFQHSISSGITSAGILEGQETEEAWSNA